MATRSAGPAFRASRASLVLPDASREALIDERGPAGLGHDDALVEQYLQLQGKTREEFDAELRESAEKSVRAQFVLDALAEARGLQTPGLAASRLF